MIVVIFSISLLIALSLPYLTKSRQQAKTIVCGSNVKQLMVAFTGYETENRTFPYGFRDSAFPPPEGYPGNIAFDRTGWWWFNYFFEYSYLSKDKKAILWCPARKIRNDKLDNVLHGNYGVNQSICKSSSGLKNKEEFIGKPSGLSAIFRPAETILIVDSGYSLITWWHAADYPPFPLNNILIEDAAYVPGLKINTARKFWEGQEGDAIQGRHPGKQVNVGFSDGHVSTVNSDSILVERTDDGYRNISPLWRPK